MSAFPRRSAGALGRAAGDVLDQDTMRMAGTIVDDIRRGGEAALRGHAERLGDVRPGERLVCGRAEMIAALDELPAADRAVLERTAERIARFAAAQRAALHDVDVPVPGGRAGHDVQPVARAGCYAPGGRFPLPSSVLMTVITARVAGVNEIWVASPRPVQVTLAAAALAGADGLLAAGGAQAIAALAFGAGDVPACDVVVGPGNRWVTAAKQLVAGHVGIDMLAGPSELVIVADGSADAETVAADLLAQAEHDPDALPVLVALDESMAERVVSALEVQLESLPGAEIARSALAAGGYCVVPGLREAAEICNRLAPEHLQLAMSDPADLRPLLAHYGALFVGGAAAEVLGDYGAGPNHVLPTGGGARFTAGLSVFNFLRIRTWLSLEPGQAVGALAADAVQLARLEGLEAHARAAERRKSL